MRFRLLISSIVLAQAVLIYAFVAQRFPLSGDDHSYLYQARLFASGRFYAEDPLYDYRHPLHPCIETNCLRDENGRRFSKYAPGWPAVLTVGVWLQAPWAVQPLLAALLAYLLLGYVEDRMGVGPMRIAALLLTLCLFFAYYGASYRPHLATALCVFGAFLAHARSRESPGHDAAWTALAGGLLGASALMRYIDWVPLGCWIGYSLLRGGRRRHLLWFAASFGVVAAGNLVYAWILSGHPFVVPTYLGGNVGGHDRLGLSWASLEFTAARIAMLCWVFPPALLLARYWSRGREAGLDRTPAMLFALNAAVYLLLPESAGGPGPRYFFSYFPLLVVAVVQVHERFVRGGSAAARRWWHVLLAAQVAGSAIFIARETYTLYWRRDVERTVALATAPASGGQVVLLTTGTYRTDAQDLTMNPPDLTSATTLYLSNCGAGEIEAFTQRFAGREWRTYSFPGHLAPLPRGEHP